MGSCENCTGCPWKTASGNNKGYVGYCADVDGNETELSYNEIFDQEYYVYIPIAGNTITRISLALNYVTKGEIKSSLWEGTDPDTSNPSQPLVLLMYVPGNPHSVKYHLLFPESA